ncbi:MAG: PASTA domain-containing protein [Burkholderiaceae bacterium]
MNVGQSLLRIALLSVIPAAVTAQTISCASVAPEVRERVRAAGACLDPPGAGVVERRIEEPATIPRRGLSPRSATAARGGTSMRVGQPALPNLVGATIEDAQAQLQGFTVERVDRASPAPVGQVIDQVPEASARIAAGSRVVVFVSSGPATIQLPSVIDRSFDDASGTLSSFTVERVEVPGASPAGRVLVQRPAAGSAVAPGSRVVLQVSDGSLTAAAMPTPAPRARATNAVVLQTATALALAIALLLIGLMFGALAMRAWLLRRKVEEPREAVLPAAAPAVDRPPAVIPVVDLPRVEPAARFFARLDAGETAIQFAHAPDDDMVEEHAHARDE